VFEYVQKYKIDVVSRMRCDLHCITTVTIYFAMNYIIYY